jgi:O-succinylbenzoate synthase
MKITEVRLRHLNMDLVAPFTTSFGTFVDKEFILVEVKNGKGLSGWAESVAFSAPWYNEETIKTNWTMLEDFLIPLVLNKEICSRIFVKIIWQNRQSRELSGIYTQKKRISL